MLLLALNILYSKIAFHPAICLVLSVIFRSIINSIFEEKFLMLFR